MSLRAKLAKAGGATAPVALAFSALAAVEVSYFPGRDSAMHVNALREKAVALAELTAHSVAPALEFEDEAVLVEFMSGVAHDPDVAYVAACSGDGRLIRALGDGAKAAQCRAAKETRVEMTESQLRVTTPIEAKTHPGSLLIAFRTEAIAHARRDAEHVALGIAAGILLLGLGVSWWIGRILRRLQALVEENRKARARAEAANEAKSAFLANMSHEIRTPMNGVIGVTQLLERSPLNDTQRGHVKTIARSGELLLAIINDILDFSKVEAGKLQLLNAPLQLRPLIAEVCESVRVTAQSKQLALEYELSPEVPAVIQADGVRLRQVLLNLLSNALKFTTAGGVTLRVSKELEDPSDHHLRIEVSDTGIGIAPEHHAVLFDAFTQVDDLNTRRYGGTGLGLAICKRLVTLMQGTIGVSSTPGQGSTFSVVVPLEPAVQVTTTISKAPSAPIKAADAAAARLLAVDDNEINRGVIEHLAKELGYAVDLVEGGREAVDRIKSGEHYAVVLMDCQMPDVDGYMATQQIRTWEDEHSSTRIPIVAVTAHALQEEEQKVRSAGMDDYLPKPVRLNTLRDLLAKWAPPA
jgi:signal transduction histidine kinase/ActR/RegA family two-component response regulator